jgi:PAS domain S-box-containing protein
MTDRKSRIAKLLKAYDELKHEVQERQRAEGEIRRNYDIQKVINSLLELIGQDITLEELLRRSVDIILSIPWLAFENRGGIFLVEDDPGVLVLKAHKNFSGSLQRNCREVPFGKCLCGMAALTQKIQFADGIDGRHEIHYEGMTPHGHYCVPILYAGKTVGAISLYLREGHAHDQKEEDFLTSVSHTLAGMIVHKRDIAAKKSAQEALQQAHVELELKIKERTAELTTVNEGMAIEIAERKAAEAALELSEKRYKLAQQAAHIGVWDWDIPSGKLYWSEQIEPIFGLEPGQFGGTYEAFLESVHPEDRQYVIASVKISMEEDEDYDIVHRIVWPDGTIRWVAEKADIIRDENGNPIRMLGVVLDITKNKQAEDVIRESKERYQLLFNSGSDAVFVHGYTEDGGLGTFIEVNQLACERLGYTREELLKMSPADIDAPDMLPNIPELLKQLTAKGHIIFEVVHVAKDGRKIPVEINAHQFEMSGKIMELSIARDITERKRSEEALKKSEETLSYAQAIAHMGHWEWDIVANVITGSDEFYRIFGTNQNNFSSLRHFREILNPDDRDRVVKAVEAALKENKPYDIEYRIVCSDRRGKYIHAQGEVTFDGAGQPVRMMGTVFDITERKRAEEELRISEEKFRSITTSAMSAIIMMDSNGEITFWNEAAQKIFGWHAEEALGKDLHALLVSEQIQEASRKTLPLFKKTGQGKLIGKIVEHTAICKNGEEVPIELSLSAVNIKGQWNAIGIVNDISMRKQAEQTLKKAKELAEMANKAKSDFLSSMSHELRTPLTAVIGFAEVLKDQYFGKLNEKQTDYVKDIFESGKHLLSLINDILDLSKVEAGKMELELSEINIRHLLEYSLIMIKEKALKHRIRLDIQIPEELSGLEIQADERQLKQVMFNLLSNAVKFTPDGGAIEVEAKQVAQELIISVSDTGIGIAPDDQEKIFDEFYQVIGGKKDKTPGTGLGRKSAIDLDFNEDRY